MSPGVPGGGMGTEQFDRRIKLRIYTCPSFLFIVIDQKGKILYARCGAYAPVKLFCPLPPGQARGQKRNVFDKKGRGTRKEGDFSDYIGWGNEKIM